MFYLFVFLTRPSSSLDLFFDWNLKLRCLTYLLHNNWGCVPPSNMKTFICDTEKCQCLYMSTRSINSALKSNIEIPVHSLTLLVAKMFWQRVKVVEPSNKHQTSFSHFTLTRYHASSIYLILWIVKIEKYFRIAYRLKLQKFVC